MLNFMLFSQEYQRFYLRVVEFLKPRLGHWTTIYCNDSLLSCCFVSCNNQFVEVAVGPTVCLFKCLVNNIAFDCQFNRGVANVNGMQLSIDQVFDLFTRLFN